MDVLHGARSGAALQQVGVEGVEHGGGEQLQGDLAECGDQVGLGLAAVLGIGAGADLGSDGGQPLLAQVVGQGGLVGREVGVVVQGAEQLGAGLLGGALGGVAAVPLVDALAAGAAADVQPDGVAVATWHYQWIIVNDFLPTVVGPELMAELLAEGPRWYRPEGPTWIPLEFADAAYRYGHSQIRRGYRLQPGGPQLRLFPDLLGFQAVPASRRVDWAQLFAFPDRPAPQPSKKIDGRLARSLIELPMAITGEVEVQADHSLAVRDLQRGQAYGLPSGEALSRALGVQPLGRDDVGLGDLEWAGETPLWYYLVKEAQVRSGGERLGPLGGRIVAEVLLGIIDRDPESYRAVQPDWQPSLPAAQPGSFDLTDLLTAAESTDRRPG